MRRALVTTLVLAWGLACPCKAHRVHSPSYGALVDSKPSTAAPLVSNRTIVVETRDMTTAAPAKSQFQGAMYVATANVLLNTLRPDPRIQWTMRLPRVLWELSIMLVANAASQTISPSLYLLFAVMMATTGLIDVFVWAPAFAAFANFKTCTGGWWFSDNQVCHTDYIKGFGRILVVVQSAMGGLFYLSTGIVAWICYITCRDQQRVQRELEILDQWDIIKKERHR